MEDGVAAVEGGGEGVRVADVAVGELDGVRQAGRVAGASHERAHVVPRPHQRRAQAPAQVPRRARHHHPHPDQPSSPSPSRAADRSSQANHDSSLRRPVNPPNHNESTTTHTASRRLGPSRPGPAHTFFCQPFPTRKVGARRRRDCSCSILTTLPVAASNGRFPPRYGPEARIEKPNPHPSLQSPA